jgi:hypothetical protein
LPVVQSAVEAQDTLQVVGPQMYGAQPTSETVPQVPEPLHSRFGV